ncbi:MAG: extracellular solute-binding protein [Aeromicrobium sp.]
MRRTVRIALAGVALGALFGLAGCAPPPGPAPDDAESSDAATDQALVEAAKAEGSVMWYTAYAEDRARHAADAFTTEYGIPVEIVRMPSPTLIQRYQAERDSGAHVADLIDYSGADPFLSAEEGEFVVLADSALPSVEAWPTDQIAGGVAPRLSLEPLGIAYNTDLIARNEVPTEWTDVVAPAMRDGLAHPNWDSPSYLKLLELLDDEFGDDFLAELRSADGTIYEGGLPAMQAVAAGENTLLLPTAASFVLPLQNSGAPVDFAVISPTIGIEVYAAVPEKAPHPNAGRLLLDFLMSVPGQAEISQNQSVSALPDVPNSLSAKGVDYRFPDVVSAAERDELLAKISP